MRSEPGPDLVLLCEELSFDNETSPVSGMVFLAMAEVVYTTYLATNDGLERARMVDQKAR